MELTFITGNTHKIKRANHVLNNYGIQVVGNNIDINEIQSHSTEKVAIQKAKDAFQKIKKPLIVMDSGIFIKDLNDFPGVYSSFVEKTIGLDGMLKLIDENNIAEIKQVICYFDGKEEKLFSSGSKGKIIQEKKGTNGYFFDYVFIPVNYEKTLAELDDTTKAIAWGDAWLKLGDWLKNK